MESSSLKFSGIHWILCLYFSRKELQTYDFTNIIKEILKDLTKAHPLPLLNVFMHRGRGWVLLQLTDEVSLHSPALAIDDLISV